MDLLFASAVALEQACSDGQCPAEPAALLKDMKLYDDSRWQYTKRTFEYFKKAVDDLAQQAATSEQAIRLRLRLLRSVDVMSYTVGIQEAYERFPPRAVHDADNMNSAGDPDEGAALWCGIQDAAHAQAHEYRILDRLLAGLSNGTGIGDSNSASKKRLSGADIGSGYGGWARMIALERPEVERIVGVEYQEHVRELAEQFTHYGFQDASELQQRMSFWRDTGSSSNDAFVWLEEQATKTSVDKPATLDFIISFLALLHIGQSRADKEKLLRGFANRLRPGGRIYFEDIAALPAAFDSSRPELEEKLRNTVAMTRLTSHADYSKLLQEAGFQASGGSSALVFDASAAWQQFVLVRSKAFQTLSRRSSLCLLKDGRVIPQSMPHAKDDEVACEALERILGDAQLVDAYLASQSNFFCDVCEVFNGRGQLAVADCQCSDSKHVARDHPPLAGGLIAFAERQ